LPGPGGDHRLRLGLGAGAEAAHRAAHGLADVDDLADLEFANDEEARAAGFVPGWQIGRHLCTDPQQYGHANVHGTPSETPTQEQKTAEDEAAAAARKTEERRRVRQRNTEWRAATDTRTSHLKALLGRMSPQGGRPCSGPGRTGHRGRGDGPA
jgi:hypothetical protein